MKAGKELDSLIFEKLFHKTNTIALNYSTNINDALKVVEEIKTLRPYILTWQGVQPGPFAMEWDETKWRVGWKITIDYEGDNFQVCAVSDTLPHAICLAALRVINESY